MKVGKLEGDVRVVWASNVHKTEVELVSIGLEPTFDVPSKLSLNLLLGRTKDQIDIRKSAVRQIRDLPRILALYWRRMDCRAQAPVYRGCQTSV